MNVFWAHTVGQELYEALVVNKAEVNKIVVSKLGPHILYSGAGGTTEVNTHNYNT